MATVDVREDSFPSRSRELSGLVNGVATKITSTSFTDKILLTISQEGRLSQWVIKYSYLQALLELTS
jgi:proteasome assembly chaperone 3